MTRLNWSSRKGPGDLDEPPQLQPVLEFDIRRGDGWPTTYFGQKFGPSLIRKAIANGFIVVAEVPDVPYPIAIKEARWCGEVLEVITLEGPRVPNRLFTRTSMKGFTTSGLLMEDDQ